MGRPWPDAAVVAGPRTYLRPPRESDRVPFRQLVEASRAFLAPWEPLAPPDAGPDHRFERLLAADDRKRNLKHFVCSLEDDRLLGCMNVNNVVRGVGQYASLGYWIGAPHAGQGYMTEALQLALAFVFGPLRLHRIEANVRPENEASVALVQRAGFRLEGRSLRYLKIAGQWADHERYAMLVDEYERPAFVRLPPN
ncbi:MAG: GNAT family protein [Planctomycetota bacterium]|nr:GNAT family protein [Planctomycetota bacterium]